jgi:hypothetical protein
MILEGSINILYVRDHQHGWLQIDDFVRETWQISHKCQELALETEPSGWFSYAVETRTVQKECMTWTTGKGEDSYGCPLFKFITSCKSPICRTNTKRGTEFRRQSWKSASYKCDSCQCCCQIAPYEAKQQRITWQNQRAPWELLDCKEAKTIQRNSEALGLLERNRPSAILCWGCRSG